MPDLRRIWIDAEGVNKWVGFNGGLNVSLSDLLDVLLSSPTNGQVLTYDGTAHKWENKASGAASPLVLTATVDTEVPLTISGHSATQSADLLELFDYVGHTKVAWFDHAGALHLATPLAVAQGGSGSASPALVAGTGVAISGAWPSETIALGGSNPFTAGFGISFSGTWPSLTISAAGGGGSPLVLTASVDSEVPLTVNGHSSSQSGDLIDVAKTSGGSKVFRIESSGRTTIRVLDDAHIPLTLQGNSGSQSGDLIQIKKSSSGALYFKQDSGGAVTISPDGGSAALTLTGTTLSVSTDVLDVNDQSNNRILAITGEGQSSFRALNDSKTPLTIKGNSGSQSAAIIRAYKDNGSTEIFKVNPKSTGGNAQATYEGTNDLGTLVPAYDSGGGQGGAQATHKASGSVNIGAGATATITLSNAAAFASGTAYTVSLSSDASTPQITNAYAQTATTFKIDNPDGANAHNFQWLAEGH